MKERRHTIICPRCGKKGFLALKWTMSSSYYPKSYSEVCDYLEMAEHRNLIDPDEEIQVTSLKENTTNPNPRIMKVRDYVEMMRKRISGNKYLDGRKEEDAYRVRYRKNYYYVAHYDPAKYQEQIKDKSSKGKSRPNGRTWCKLPKEIDPDSLTRVD